MDFTPSPPKKKRGYFAYIAYLKKKKESSLIRMHIINSLSSPLSLSCDEATTL